jgi:nitrilase
MKLGIVQIEPVYLDAQRTWNKLKDRIIEASNEGAKIVTWGETLIPGYPEWPSISHGAQFNSSFQKKVYSKYWHESLTPVVDPIVKDMKKLSKDLNIMMIGGVAEKEHGSTYCTLLTIDNGNLLGRHRKLKPTYEERLVWADARPEDVHLKTYPTEIGNIGGLNCWENWIPYARAALHKQNEFVHVSIWPGSLRTTKDICKFMAIEGRYYSIGASGMLRADTLHEFLNSFGFTDNSIFTNKNYYQDGGSIIYSPSGECIAGPLVEKEGILLADLDQEIIIQERQNFDYSGHYSRFDVFNDPLNK